MASDPPAIPPAGHSADGYLLDGETAHRQPVRLFLKPENLGYQTRDGAETIWNFSSIDWELSQIGPAQTRIARIGDENAWIVTADPAFASAIKIARRQWRARHGHHLLPDAKSALYISAISIFVLMTLWFGWPLIADHLASHVPASVRDRLGAAAYGEYLHDNPICHTPAGDRALSAMQARLSSGNDFLQNVKIVVSDSKMVNALTLPDNRVIISRGLLAKAQSGDEIAGIMAHELGHVIHNHVMRTVLGSGMASLLVASMGDGQSASGMANVFVGNAYSQKYESEADQTGLQILQAAKISPDALGAFFARLQKAKGSSRLMTYFSDHPPPADRMAMIATFHVENPTPVLTQDQWSALQTICGPNPPPKAESGD